jgi:hypothetical protein
VFVAFAFFLLRPPFITIGATLFLAILLLTFPFPGTLFATTGDRVATLGPVASLLMGLPSTSIILSSGMLAEFLSVMELEMVAAMTPSIALLFRVDGL